MDSGPRRGSWRTGRASGRLESARRCAGLAFTLIELLVVIAIIALLVSILLPSLSRARRMAAQVVCLTRTREWGQGSQLFATENNDAVAFDGEDNPGGVPDGGNKLTYQYDIWWANAVVPYVKYTGYRQIAERARDQGDAKNVPLPGNEGDGIFICPSARLPYGGDTPSEAPYPIDWSDLYFYFNYVPNSKLENGSQITWRGLDVEKIRLTDMKKPTATVLMLELRATKRELPSELADDPQYNKSLNRAKAMWSRMAARHDAGSNVVYADGHGEKVSLEYANEKASADFVNPERDGYNKHDLIWSPLTHAD